MYKISRDYNDLTPGRPRQNDAQEGPMINGNMTVTEFVMVLWHNKIKVGLLILAIAFGPYVYDDWKNTRAVQKLEADRASVDHEASIAGMMLASAWKSCRDIGIVNEMERCAVYEGRLIQEQSVTMLAKMAIEHRASFYERCQRFHIDEYCKQLLQRSMALSFAQGNRKSDD